MSKPEDSLHQLKQRTSALRKQVDGVAPTGNAGVSHGMRAGLDLTSGVAVGTAVGYALDYWLGTLPIAMLICLCLGTAAGIKLMMETSRRAAAELEKTDKMGE